MLVGWSRVNMTFLLLLHRRMEQEATVSVSVEEQKGELPGGADPEVVGLGVSGSAPVSDGVHRDGDGEHREGSDDSEKDGSVESGYQTQTALGEREGSDQESKDEEKVVYAFRIMWVLMVQ